MKYIIFGCGITGKGALQSIGEDLVKYFVDNYHSGETVCGKPVLSFQEMLSNYKEDAQATIVIASDKYYQEMEAQIRAAGISRYHVFHSYSWPHYMRNREDVFPTRSNILKNYNISRYQRIGIYGIGFEIYLSLLVDELQKQAPSAKIVLIPESPDVKKPDSISLPIMDMEAAQDWMDCLIINISRKEDPSAVRDRLEEAPYAIADLFAADLFDPAFHYEGMERFKNIHAGKRVFVIGNGPSLTFADLNTLHEHGEICFGFNMVYRAYDRTPWRADYLGISDARGVEISKEKLQQVPGQKFFSDAFHFYPNKRFPDVQYFHVPQEDFYPNCPGFSANPSKCMYNGWTVVYDIGLQLAAYMGFKEIYLLGVDNGVDPKNCEKDHFIEDYLRLDERKKYNDPTNGRDFFALKTNKAYEKAERYSRAHGFRIFNATRGGRLEIFERVDFDSLFSE